MCTEQRVITFHYRPRFKNVQFFCTNLIRVRTNVLISEYSKFFCMVGDIGFFIK
jgi:hypothetical protein